MSDNVNHPEHYTSGGIECIDAIRASLGLKEFADYCKGNVIKYVWRYRHKNGVEDLKKARVYLNWMIEAEEEKKDAQAENKQAILEWMARIQTVKKDPRIQEILDMNGVEVET